MQQRILIGGHRGLGGTDNANARKWRDSANLIPENTLAGLTGALTGGADYIEFDVVPAKDGLVIAHNAKLADHMFPPPAGKTVMNELTLAEIAELRVGHRRADGDTPPTLAAVLAAVKPLLAGKSNADKFINIEVKDLQQAGVPFTPADAQAFSAAVHAEVKKAGLVDRVLFSSFNVENIAALATLDPQARLGMLFEAAKDDGDTMHVGDDVIRTLGFTAARVTQVLDAYPLEALNPPVQEFAPGGTGPACVAAAIDWAQQNNKPLPAFNIWALNEEPTVNFLPLWRAALDACRDVPTVGLITDYPVELRVALSLENRLHHEEVAQPDRKNEQPVQGVLDRGPL